MGTIASLLLRLSLTAIYWFGAIMAVHYSLLGITLTTSSAGGSGMMIFIGAAIIIAGIVLSERLLGLRVGFRTNDAAPTSRKAAIEPEALRLRDMISLLDEDDLDDLRTEVRETLRDRIHRLSADETETFEELLSDSKRKRR